jgi:hypothetical protein
MSVPRNILLLLNLVDFNLLQVTGIVGGVTRISILWVGGGGVLPGSTTISILTTTRIVDAGNGLSSMIVEILVGALPVWLSGIDEGGGGVLPPWSLSEGCVDAVDTITFS